MKYISKEMGLEPPRINGSRSTNSKTTQQSLTTYMTSTWQKHGSHFSR